MNNQFTIRIAGDAIKKFRIETCGRSIPSTTILRELKYYLRHHQHSKRWRSQGWLEVQFNENLQLHLRLVGHHWAVDRISWSPVKEVALNEAC